MKRIVLILLVIFICAFPVSAQESYTEDIDRLTQQQGIDFEQIVKAPFETLWNVAKEAVTEKASANFGVFYRITAVIIVTSFVNLFAQDKSSQVAKLVSTVVVLVIFSNVYTQSEKIIDNIAQSFFDVKNFMLSFLPVFAGVSFASGEMVTSTVYTGFFLVAVTSVANFCINWIVPSLNIFTALGLVSSVSTLANLRPLCQFYSKAVKTAMTAAVSVLCFVLSLQTAITQGQDSLAVKAGKLIVTSAVPVIGSALQGAVGSVYASMSVLKGFCGLAGIAVVVSIFLPHTITLAVNWLGFMLMEALSSLLENHTAHSLIGTFREVTEIMLSVTVLFSVLLLFSLTIMIKTIQVV